MNRKIYSFFLVVISMLLLVNSSEGQVYCQPTTSCTFPDIITNVTFAGINRTSVCDAPGGGGYSSWPSPSATVVQGLSYPISVSTGGDVEGVAVWIDYNHNFVYEATEVLFTPAYTGTNPATYSYTVNVPLTATPGLTGMRVRCKYAGAPLASDNDPCAAYTFGETEDYTVNIVASTPCTGTPTAGIATANPANPCPGVASTMTLTGSSLVGGLTYQWVRSSTGNAPWIPLGAANAINYTTTVPPGITYYYRCIVTCSGSGLFDTSSAVSVTVQPWSPTSPCYCTSGAQNNTDQTITNVTLGSLNNTTDCVTPLVGTQGVATGNPNQYADFTGVGGAPAPIAYVGLSTPFSLTAGTCGGSVATSASIFIDYNHNASFSDPGEEVYTNIAIATVPSVVSGAFTPPPAALAGVTRMRVTIMSSWIGTITPCLSYGYGETEDYLINIVPPSPYDPAITSMTTPSGNCYSAAQVITAQLCNYGTTPIDLSVNPVTVTLNVNGPNGITPYTTTVSTGLLNSYGASCVTAIFTGVNMYAGGSYSLNTSLTVSGLTNGLLSNDSLTNPIIKVNYRPTAGAPYQLCQYDAIPFGQGLTVTGCATPINDSAIIIFNVTPVPDNTGATTTGTSQTVPGAAAANEFAGNFGNALVPSIPAGALFTQNAVLTVSNLSSSFMTEPRFILYSGTPSGATLFAPCPQGYNVGAGNVLAGGQSIGSGSNFTNKREITPTQLGNLFSYFQANPASSLNLGYFETWNDNLNTSDIGVNAGGATTCTLKVYYQYVPASFEWYSVPTAGVNLYSLSPFNPLITTGSGISNSNTPGTTTFYAACVGSSNCRIPVNLNINPVPVVVQDTMSLCESTVGSNSAIFDLTTMDGPVSAFVAPAVDVEYYGDQGLFFLLPTPTMDTTSTNFVYSKVIIPATGCFSKDSLLLQVNGQPEFPSPIVTGFACAPASIDVANLINPFSTVPVGADTLYYSDAAYTIPHPNPHAITSQDTVYMVFATNTNPVCADSAIAYVDILPADNKITAQDPTFNYSIPGYYGCVSTSLLDGLSDTIRSSVDCRRVAAVTDIANTINLGNVSTCLDVAASIPYHNGQPYSGRTYQITAATSDTANVCLYYLDDDFQLYNADAIFNGWPLLPTAASMPANMGNIAVTKVDLGDLNTPGHVATAIPNSSINASYDPGSTVWTVCFPVSGFSYFYLHTQNPFNIPLPVNMVSFTGKKVAATSVLNWTTMTEQNNSHFVVERSKDGKSFSRLSDNIASKAANGNSNEALNYTYTDATPYQGHNYYRLQQNDIDGKASYSKVVDIYFGNETLVTMYPNPVNSNLHVDINTPKATVATMKIMDATGRTVKVVEMQLQEGNNTTQVDMQGLADGVYMINITNAKGLNYAQPIRKN